MAVAGALAFLASAALAGWWTPWFAAFARSRGLVAHPSPRGVHRMPTPVSGGLTIVASATVVLAVTWHHAPLWLALPALLMFALGVVDDAIELRWTSKLLFEALIVVIAFELAGDAHLSLSCAVGIAWVLAVTNAMNFIDNMDGLAPGQGAIVLLALASIAFATGVVAVGIVAIVVAGASTGFFAPNFFRATAFLGDAGSLLLGFVAGITSFALAHHHVYAALPLAYPVFDVVFVVVRRVLRGENPVRGGTDHTSHALAAALGSTRAAVTLLLAGTSVLAAIAVVCAVVAP